MYPFAWKPLTEDPADKTGIGTYMVDGEQYQFLLPTFADGQKLGKMLSVAFHQGRQFGASTIKDVVISAATRRAQDFGA